MKLYEEGPIKDFVLGIFDGPHSTPKESDSGPIFLGIKNVRDGSLDLSDIRHVSERDFPKWTKRVTPQPDDIVFSYEATLHRYAIIPEGFKGCLGRRIALIRPNPQKAEHKFLLYYFLSHKWRKVVEGSVISGATVDRIPLIRFPDFPVSLPPLNIQQKIAAILSNYGDMIENNLRRIELLDQSARLLYEEWFVRLRFPEHERVRVKDGVPDGWKRATAFDVMEVHSGGTPRTGTPEYWDGNIPFYTPKDAHKYAYVLETQKTLTDAGLSKCNSKLYPKNTVFITARGTVGNVNLAQSSMAMNQSCYALKGKGRVSQFFLFCAIRNSIEQFHQRAVGAVFDAIIVDTFKSIPFLLPGDETIRSFEQMVSLVFRQIENLLVQNQKLKQARDLLLPKLMNGEITV